MFLTTYVYIDFLSVLYICILLECQTRMPVSKTCCNDNVITNEDVQDTMLY